MLDFAAAVEFHFALVLVLLGGLEWKSLSCKVLVPRGGCAGFGCFVVLEFARVACRT